jgi:predicted phosphoribosyltransferase
VRFADLADAGRQLAALLPSDLVEGCVVLAVPLTVVGMALLKVRLARLGRSSPLTGG